VKLHCAGLKLQRRNLQALLQLHHFQLKGKQIFHTLWQLHSAAAAAE
jgi:hypothetical protein